MTAAATDGVPRWLLDAAIGLAASAYQAGRAEGNDHGTQAAAAPDVHDVLTRGEVARELRCSVAKVQLLIKSEELRSFKIGARRLIRRNELDAYIDSLASGTTGLAVAE